MPTTVIAGRAGRSAPWRPCRGFPWPPASAPRCRRRTATALDSPPPPPKPPVSRLNGAVTALTIRLTIALPDQRADAELRVVDRAAAAAGRRRSRRCGRPAARPPAAPAGWPARPRTCFAELQLVEHQLVGRGQPAVRRDLVVDVQAELAALDAVARRSAPSRATAARRSRSRSLAVMSSSSGLTSGLSLPVISSAAVCCALPRSSRSASSGLPSCGLDENALSLPVSSLRSAE